MKEKQPLCRKISVNIETRDFVNVLLASSSGIYSASVQQILLLVGSGASTFIFSHMSIGHDEYVSSIWWRDEHLFEFGESAQHIRLFL